MEGLTNVTNTERIGHAGGECLPCLASLLVLIWVVGAVTSWEVFAFPGIHIDLQPTYLCLFLLEGDKLGVARRHSLQDCPIQSVT